MTNEYAIRRAKTMNGDNYIKFNMKTIEILKATVQDKYVITDINTRAFNDETNRFGPGRDGGPEGYNIVEEVAGGLSHNDSYKIMLGDELIGWFWLRQVDDNTIELEDFCIDPLHHNKGYGYQSMLKMFDLKPEIRKWTLGTPHYSISNQYLYEKVGYKKTGISPDGFLFLYELERPREE